MSLRDTLLNAVKTVDTVTKSLQATVTFQKAVVDATGYHTPDYPTSVSLLAIVDWKQKPVRNMQGVMTVSRASVIFLDVAALVMATNGEGVNDLDRITLPDGTTGPIIDLSGFIDAGTGKPFATEVMLG